MDKYSVAYISIFCYSNKVTHTEENDDDKYKF